jgi:hypothetical protein
MGDRMTSNDVQSAICVIVAEEVAHVLEPYRSVMNRMLSFFGSGSQLATHESEKTVATQTRIRRRRGSKTKLSPRIDRFTKGQKVTYKQGRGVFEAKVVSIDTENGVLNLERSSDRKRVDRPADKVKAS